MTNRRSRTHPIILTVSVGLLLIVGGIAGVSYGSTSLPLSTVWESVWRGLSGQALAPGTVELIVWQIRLPRPLVAMTVGAGLGLAGLAVQALIRNPLAEPYLLGISAGASLGAVAMMVLGVGALATFTSTSLLVPSAAFLGALGSFTLVWAVIHASSRNHSFAPMRIILAGVAIGQLLSGLTSFLVLQADDQEQTRSVLFWLMGSLGSASWPQLPVVTAGVVIVGGWLWWRARHLNALVAGDETAAALGVPTARLRRELLAAVSLLTAVLVAVSGAIGFVGLVVPHICRLLVGGDHRRLVPLAGLVGATGMVWVDLGCRAAAHLVHQELPVNVLTAVIGAPVLLVLLARRAAL